MSTARTPLEPQAEAPLRLARTAWAFAGYATPEAALQSVLWSQTKGDLNTYLAGLAPEAQNELKSALQRKPDLAGSIMAEINKVDETTILKTVPLADDSVLLHIRNKMAD